MLLMSDSYLSLMSKVEWKVRDKIKQQCRQNFGCESTSVITLVSIVIKITIVDLKNNRNVLNFNSWLHQGIDNISKHPFLSCFSTGIVRTI